MKWTMRLSKTLQYGYGKRPKINKVVTAYGFSATEAQSNALAENPEFQHVISMKKVDN